MLLVTSDNHSRSRFWEKRLEPTVDVQDPLGTLAQNLSGNNAVQAYWAEAFKNATTPGAPGCWSNYMYWNNKAK